MGSDPSPLMINEIRFEDYPKPVPLETMEKITIQMKYSICKIYNREVGKGSGFFCIIQYDNIKITTLITNYHVINEKYIEKYKQISISLNNDKKNIIIKLDNNRKKYFSEDYDVAIIEIKEKDNINNNQYLELDDNIYKEIGNDYFVKNPVYNISYQNGEKVYASYGLTKDFQNDFIIRHLCMTESGSSGSPLLNLSNHKVIGIHSAGSQKFSYNFAIILKSPIKEFIKKYKNEINNNFNNNIDYNNIEKSIDNKNNNNDTNNYNDINRIEQSKNKNSNYVGKNEYNNNNFFEANKYNNNNDEKSKSKYNNNNYIKHNNNSNYYRQSNYNNTNNLNNEIYQPNNNLSSAFNYNVNNNNNNNNINFNNTFNGWISPYKNESNYYLYGNKDDKIKNKKIKNNEIILKLQVTKEDVNEKIYFINKSFQKKFLNKSNFEITINSKNIDYEKYYFKPKEKGEYTIILKFKFNIKDCSYMFLDCKNITYMDLTSLDTKEVENMSNMFKNCTNLAKLNFSDFDTNNVINMEYMFFNCIKLNSLNLNSFNTSNVNNMDGMFCNCSNLSNIEFGPKFNSENASVNNIFTKCNKYMNLKFNGESDDKLIREFMKINN